ncbi:MAG: carboxypeptidase-like regulatory domain-containing protein, partial [Muribaculaceae bacterium]|nr:carboxypeptidase-like regulatory domain-containing protein [Muribaculaceae bacterium]
MGSYFVLEKSDSRDGSFWEANRLMPLSSVEEKMGGFMQEARHNKVLFWGEKLLRLLESGYVITGKPSKFDFGPINTLISANTVEGVRFRLGGMTVAALNPHLFTAAYIAYGTKDKKFKYDVKMEYSFEKKKMHSFEWPRHGFFARYGYDVDMIGQHYLFTNSDNVFLSFKRKESILATYRRIIELGYIIELKNNFSFEARIRKETQEATKWIEFKFPDGRVIGKYGQNAMALSLRWAPGEKFIQGRTTRSPVNMDAWVFQLTHEFGPKGLGGSSFSLNRTELKIQKRLWFSAFGYTDIIAKGGIIWSSVFFPALLWPNTNLSYTIQPESFSLLNPMEFANDKYGSLDLSYYGMGVLF